ncbi:helix-turn-helix domain-containing protein [uncultured Mucilaginibacter sp.]|uniref:winged helix-turn-helix transcriptional regulator n=1 Tax=uncultured Mucilaginibacter sp. TaxID=797541 RepID=UPI0026382DC2|nr:helix-turn-helix domain-containing protein [uncultured Mucilaginibacter sp.]
MSGFKELMESEKIQQCPRRYVLALTDTLNVVHGKWKLPIIAALLRGQNRFKDLLENIEKITPRMLSKELKELEINGIVERQVYNRVPVLIEYRLTASGKNITGVIDSMIDWGMQHRTETITGKQQEIPMM